MILESITAAVILAGANYADYSTTQDARARGGIERGPQVMQTTAGKAALVAVETGVFMAIRKHHKKTAWAYVAVIVGVNLAIANHNKQVLVGQPKAQATTAH